MRRLEAHADEHKLAPVCKISALRMLMTGKSKEYSDLWEADRDHTGAAKSYDEFLNKARDYAHKRKLTTRHKNMQQGGDSVEVAAVGGLSWYVAVNGEYDYDGVSAVGFKGKGKNKGECK